MEETPSTLFAKPSKANWGRVQSIIRRRKANWGQAQSVIPQWTKSKLGTGPIRHPAMGPFAKGRPFETDDEPNPSPFIIVEREGPAVRGAFAVEIFEPCPLLAGTVVFRIAMCSCSASVCVVLRHARKRCLFGALTPHRPVLRHGAFPLASHALHLPSNYRAGKHDNRRPLAGQEAESVAAWLSPWRRSARTLSNAL